jgi:hypothetical protein
MVKMTLWRLSEMLLQLAAYQQVEFLIGTAKLDVGLHGHRIIALAKRVEQFVNGDRLPTAIALGKIVALEHACDGMQRGQTNHA